MPPSCSIHGHNVWKLCPCEWWRWLRFGAISLWLQLQEHGRVICSSGFLPPTHCAMPLSFYDLNRLFVSLLITGSVNCPDCWKRIKIAVKKWDWSAYLNQIWSMQVLPNWFSYPGHFWSLFFKKCIFRKISIFSEK